MKTIPEDSVKLAFATMMNKLSSTREVVLLPLERNLKRISNDMQLSRLEELESLLEKNTERKNQVMDFFTSGLLDPAVNSEEIMRLEEERKTIVKEQDLISKNLSGGHERQKSLEDILSYTAKKNIITEFDDSLFLKYVDHIIVYSRTEIGFVMKFGPIFKERI